ncbi:MAG TPA: DUF4157 domain-containing protein [Anaerolineaceae bacterium]
MTKVSTTLPDRVKREPIHPAGRQAISRISTTTIERVPKSALQRAVTSPQTAKPRAIRALSHFSGNRAISGLFQANLDANQDENIYEQGVDQTSNYAAAVPADGGAPPPKTTPLVQRQGEGAFEVPPEMDLRLHHLQGGGTPLPSSVRSRMESNFGADFSQVRLHRGVEATNLSQRIQAKAFTYGKDIYLGPHANPPESISGQRLLAHELAHVIQQTGSIHPSPRKEAKLSNKDGQSVQRFLGGLFGKKKQSPENSTQSKPKETGKPTGSTTLEVPQESKPTELEPTKPEDKTNPNPYAITNLGVRPDYAEESLKDKVPDQFILTIAVVRERSDNLKFAKERLESSIRNKLREFGKKIPLIGKLIRTPKTSEQIKTKAARKVFEGKTKEEQAKDIQSAHNAGLISGSTTDSEELKKENEKKGAIAYIESQSGQVGHTWVKLSTKSGGSLQEISSFGFWPKKWREGMNVRGGFGHPNTPVPGQVMHPDTIHDNDADVRYIDVPLKGVNYKTALAKAVSRFKAPPSYVLSGYNCTKFAQEIASSAGASFPGSPIVPGWYADLLNKLSGEQEGSKGFVSPTLSPGGTYEGMQGMKGVYTSSTSPKGIEQPSIILPNATTSQFEQHEANAPKKPPPPEPEIHGKKWSIDLENTDEIVHMVDQWGNLTIQSFKDDVIDLEILDDTFPNAYTADSIDYIKVKYEDEIGMICACDLIRFKSSSQTGEMTTPQTGVSTQNESEMETEPQETHQEWKIDLEASDATVSLYAEGGKSVLQTLADDFIEMEILTPDFPKKFQETSTALVKIKYGTVIGMIRACDLFKYKA